jgi:hypothetical protein
MEKNLSKDEELVRLFIGAAIIGYGLYRSKWFLTAGALPLLSALLEYDPVKEFIQKVKGYGTSVSELNDHEIEAEDGSGGYRTGNPVTGGMQGNAGYSTS